MARTRQQHNEYHKKYYDKNKGKILKQKSKKVVVKNIEEKGFQQAVKVKLGVLQPPSRALKAIPGFDNAYYISAEGIICEYSEKLELWVETPTYVGYTGNLLVSLLNNKGRSVIKSVMSIMQELWFKKTCMEGKILIHKNGNKLDNGLKNLGCRRKRN
jgi:hypothetical protein